jgi:Flp pilus assembly protein TadD
MLRSPPRLLALLLAASALTGCGAGMSTVMDTLSGTPTKVVDAKPRALSQKAAAGDLDGNLRQAQLLRQGGSYDEALHILSQLMLAAGDDPRVSAEYGKTLAQKGRAQEATDFLRRAIELSPRDWTLYSALGVSYDQLNDANNARMAYDHALALKPGEASVLNNYALSRMLAKDTEGARLLIAQAQAAAGAAPDEKIARNIALINGLVPDAAADAKPTAVASAAKKLPAPQIVAAAPPPKAVAAPRPLVAMNAPPIPVTPMPMPQARAADANAAPQNANDVSRLLASQSPGASNAPRALAQMAAVPAQPISQAPSGVVMQAVPYDPFAGPVLTLKKPRPKAVAKAAPAKDDKADIARADAPKPQKTAAATKPGVVPALRVAVDNY